MKRFLQGVVLLSLAGLLSGCATTRDDIASARLRVQSLIDGADSLLIRGDQMWFQHHAYELPGHWMGGDEPTIINRTHEWYPVWIGSESDRFVIPDKESALPPNRAFNEHTLTVSYSGGWGRVMISQYPSAENDFTLIVTIDDRGPDGASWYDLGIDWD